MTAWAGEALFSQGRMSDDGATEGLTIGLGRLLDALSDEVFIADADGQTVWVNVAGLRYYGVGREDLIGRNVSDLERSGFFRPSATLRVLERRAPVTIVQDTRMGNRLLVASRPLTGDRDEIQFVVSTSKDLSEICRLSRETENLRVSAESPQELSPRGHSLNIVAESLAMKEVVKTCAKVARANCTVFITGETGVGKDLLAEFIHAESGRRDGPFIRVNCGAVPQTLVESELFGYEGGAFTGSLRRGKPGLLEMAHGGSVFLDEVADLPLEGQVKLLRFLQYGEVHRVGSSSERRVDVRVIAATNQDVEKLVECCRFRRDLYYRLNVIRIRVLPLRERREDIPCLVNLFLDRFSRVHGLGRKEISTPALERLIGYSWPGNVRELQNVVESLVLTVDGDVIEESHVAAVMGDTLHGGCPPVSVHRVVPLSVARQELERQLLNLCRHSCKTTYEIAKVLGVNQSTVVRALKKLSACKE